ncbi:hypothetical protein F3Y22_tig00116951pilonHSYRG00899 [Hibiscus syriacus]|uniref:Uncharacterized protein n=1 Tax=Hibiscus syriacus TaxID=106335 RepID=A0A6A2WYQ9_HIBSY|nr:hypothetical protein F3Y22_tig00116951pilonHSYRG00899 [Hibiscus syriacus]
MDRLLKCNANYVPLTPLMFLKRASNSYANRTSIIYENIRFTWHQTYERCCHLDSSMQSFSIHKNHVVSVLAPNIPAMYEMHFDVPMSGEILNTINTRLDAKNIATILRHSEAKVFFVYYQYVQLASEALRMLMAEQGQSSNMPLVIVIDDLNSPTGVRLGELEYEELIHTGNPGFVPVEIHDEWDPVTLNYTSGTISEPKGVVYSHRGTYLSTLSLILGWEMSRSISGLSLCSIATVGPLRGVLQPEAKPDERREISSPVQVLTGGAPPPASLLEKMEHLGFHITHAYGMMEATGPALVCEWQAKWNHLSNEREIVLRGSSIMKGYLKDEEATSKALKNGWFFIGDVGVIHPDGNLEIKDRSKDVIISGGENISSVELESVLYKHPRVLEAAVVAMPHPRWGESPGAFILVRENDSGETEDVKETDIIAYCRKNLSHFMVPKKVKFLSQLPKTSTGKVQKFQLRAMAKSFQLTEKKSKVNKEIPEYHGDQQHAQILALSRL